MSIMVKGNTRLVGIMGWPVGHSRSPLMHNAAFAALGLDWAYVPLPVRPEHVGEAVRGLRALGFAGTNVTVPHKQAVVPHLDELTAAARAAGAVNTIVVREDETLLGDTTDGPGFLCDLHEHGAAPGDRALVIGSGGAARAVTFALAELGSAVSVCARDVMKARDLCRTIADALPATASRLSAHSFPTALARLAPAAHLIVNATSLGLHEDDPPPWDFSVPFQSNQVVYDLIYHRPTAFLSRATADGAHAIGGVGMLVHQGAIAFELWTGHPAPINVMHAALRG